jgi:hypothetical protein
MRQLTMLAVFSGMCLLALPLHAQLDNVSNQTEVTSIPVGGTPLVSAAEMNLPAPRLPDGKPDLSGPWVGGGTNNNFLSDTKMKKEDLERLMQPWAREVWKNRKIEDEPYTACLPQGPLRVNPYPWRIVQSYTAKGMTHIFIVHETGDAGAHRQIFMDGRQHPKEDDLFPTWFGHSIGHWDGDTLVVDTIGFNDKSWYDATGVPHTEKLHTIERFTRPNYGTLNVDVTLDDPGTFTQQLNLHFTARRIRSDLDLMEFICLEDNEYGKAGNFVPANENGVRAPAK